MPSFARRAFLATSSLAFTRASLGLRRSAVTLPVRSRQPVATFFPDIVDSATLRTLALAGMEVAERAGATYADIRIADLRSFEMTQFGMVVPYSDLDLSCAYGLRVLVQGTWAFVFGADPTVDSIARAAHAAVDTARGVSKLNPHRVSMSPVPVVQGEWVTPIEIDPFAVSPDEHAKVLGACKEAAQRVPDGDCARLQVTWTAETRVFASTEGSLVTQRLTRVEPMVRVQVWQPPKHETILPVQEFSPTSAGFENVLGPALQECVKATTEEAARLARYPEGNVEVGRYAAVLDGTAMSALCGATLAQALEIDRVLGREADGMGTSFLASASDVLGAPLFSPHLTVIADRNMPHYGAAKWDDEGAATTSFPLIQQGRVVEYFTTRTSASAFTAIKSSSMSAVRGSAVSWTPMTSPTGCASQLAVAASSADTTLDTLVKQMAGGILIRGVDTHLDQNGVHSDQQLAGGALIPMMLYEVKQGQITRRLRGGMVQFDTKQFLNSILAMGGRSTLQHHTYSGVRGETWARTTQPVVAPAAHVTHLDVTLMGGKL